ncbi:MAG: hypothetical protein HY921_06525 [Elusimicrobia bacterium]|nr:hypothetical protein [Elusimicrobiota bacterium]
MNKTRLGLLLAATFAAPAAAQIPSVSSKAVEESAPAIICKGDIYRYDPMRSPRRGFKYQPRQTSYKVELDIYFDWSKYVVEKNNGIEVRVHQARVEEKITDFSGLDMPRPRSAWHENARLQESKDEAHVYLDELGLTFGAEIKNAAKESFLWIHKPSGRGDAYNVPSVPRGTSKKDEEFARVRQAQFHRYASLDCALN